MPPIYIYQNDETGEHVEIVQTMKEEHVFNGKDGTEIGKWRRVFTSPQMSVDARVDPFSSKQFVEKTGTKKGTFGDIMDRSKEMSEARAALAGGTDPVKEKYFENYAKERKGAKHPEQMKQGFENSKVKVDYSSD